MSGLLDFIDSPLGQGLLAAGFGAAAGAGRGRGPWNTLGTGGLAGLAGYARATDLKDRAAQEAQERELRAMQIGQLKEQLADQTLARTTAAQFYTPATPATGMLDASLPPELRTGAAPLPGKPASFDMQGYAQARMQQNPIAGMQLLAELRKGSKFSTTPHQMMVNGKLQNVLIGEDGSVKTLEGFGVKPEMVEQDLGGSRLWVDKNAVQPGQSFAKTANPFSDVIVGDGQGGFRPNTPLIDAKSKIAKAGATNVNVDAAPKAFWGDFGKSASDALFKEREGAQGAVSVLQGVNEIRKASEGGAYQGAGAEMKLGAAKALNALGANISPETVANSELFNAHAKQFVLSQIKMLGANPSNADREFIEKTVPSLSTDPNALPKLLDFLENRARGQVDTYNTKIRGVQKQPGAGFMPFSLEVQAPEPYKADPKGGPASAAAAPPTPIKGMVRGGYRFKGGDPTQASSWEKI